LDLAMLACRVLGQLEVERDGVPVLVGGAKQQALLALLLLDLGRPISAPRLIDGLWGGEAPPSAAKALQLYVSQLRKALGSDAIATRDDAYVVPVRNVALDLREFESLAESGRAQASAGRAADAASLLTAAQALWRGDALEGLDAPGLAPARARLDELRLVVQELLFDVRLGLGQHAAVLPDLTMLSRRYPLRGRLHEQLMLALYRDGRQVEALDVYRRLRDTLRDEVGLEPHARLRDLERAILRQDRQLDVPEPREADRTVVGMGASPERLASLLSPLARETVAELILVTPVPDRSGLAEASRRLEPQRSARVRVAAFVSRQPGADVARLAAEEGAQLVVLDTPPSALAEAVPAGLREAACDVALFVDAAVDLPAAAVTVLFGGSADDWRALELGAMLARAWSVPLRLAGAEDASVLLARAALVVQRFAAVSTAPALFAPDDPATLAAAAAGSLLVAGAGSAAAGALPPSRSRLGALGLPLLLLRPGVRPGVLAPSHTFTRFSWSLLG
jgi:DNA-binding SARP family transcriptional activator